MLFGVVQQTQPEAGQPYAHALRKVVDVCLYAEELGFRTFSMAEQHFSPYILNPDSLQFFSYLAAKTTRIRFASGIIVLPLHHPIQLAERVALLDVQSDGRFDLGCGRGHIRRAFEGMGIPMEEASERFDECLEVAKLAWGPEPFMYRGRFYQTLEPISVNPKPVQKPHPPIWVAATTPETVGKVARNDCGMLVSFLEDFEPSKERVGVFKALRAEAGHAPETARIRMNPLALVLESHKEANQVAESYLRRWGGLFATANKKAPEGEAFARHQQSEQWQRLREMDTVFDYGAHAAHAIFGDPAFAVERLAYLRDDVGATEINFCVGFGGLPLEVIRRSLKLLAEHVIPRL